MANVFMDGFEIDFANDSIGLWDSYTTNAAAGKLTYVATNKRTGNGGVRFLSTSSPFYMYLSKTLPGAYAELYFGFGLYFASTTSLDVASTPTGVPIFALRSSGGTTQITLAIHESTRVLMIYAGHNKGTLLGSGSVALAANTMHYIEGRVVIHDSTGIVQIRLNGNMEINLSNVDTNVSGGDIKTINMGVTWNGSTSEGASIDAFFDDVIINDTTGTVSNSWPDGAGITMLVPNEDGNHTAWTSTGGAVDYTEIDDVTTYGNLPDGDTTTILSGTTGQRTSVNLSNTTQPGSVEAIMLCTYAKNSVSGSDQMAQSVRIGSTDYDSTAFVPATAYGWRTDILTLNPATAARWLTSELDAMQQGFSRVT